MTKKRKTMLKKFFVTIASMMALGSFAGTLEPLVYPPIQDSVSWSR